MSSANSTAQSAQQVPGWSPKLHRKLVSKNVKKESKIMTLLSSPIQCSVGNVEYVNNLQ